MQLKSTIMFGPSFRRVNIKILALGLAFILPFSFFCCDNSTTTIVQENLVSDSVIVIEPVPATDKLKVLENTMIAISAKPFGGYFIRTVNLANNSKIEYFLKKGYGPQETDDIVPQSLSIYQNKINIVNKNAELIKFSIQNYSNQGIEKKQLPVETIPTNDLKMLNDSIIIGHSSSGLINKELFIFNLNSSELKMQGDYFNIKRYSNISKNTLYDLNYSFIEVHSQNNLIASIYSKFDKLIIRNLSDDSIKESMQSYADQKPLVNDRGEINFNEIIPFCIDVDSDDRFIYRLGFMNLTNQEIGNLSMEEMKNINTYLNVYDWNGDLLYSFSLDQPIFKFDINNKLLFGMNPFEDDKLYIYDLQKIY